MLHLLEDVVGKLRQSLRIFLQSVPDELQEHNLERVLSDIEEVVDVHDVHLWSLDGDYNVGTIHIVVAEGTSQERIREIKLEARKQMEAINITHNTIEIGTEDEPCPYKEC